jgi:hypothetical protein
MTFLCVFVTRFYINNCFDNKGSCAGLNCLCKTESMRNSTLQCALNCSLFIFCLSTFTVFLNKLIIWKWRDRKLSWRKSRYYPGTWRDSEKPGRPSLGIGRLRNRDMNMKPREHEGAVTIVAKVLPRSAVTRYYASHRSTHIEIRKNRRTS